jgi:hypothetical protein
MYALDQIIGGLADRYWIWLPGIGGVKSTLIPPTALTWSGAPPKVNVFPEDLVSW